MRIVIAFSPSPAYEGVHGAMQVAMLLHVNFPDGAAQAVGSTPSAHGPPPEPAAVAAATTAIGRAPADRPAGVVICDFWCPEYDGDGVASYDSAPDRTDVVTVTYDLAGSRPDSGHTADMVQPGPDPDSYPPIDPTEPVPDDPGELSPDTPETLPPAPVEPMPGPDDPGSVPVLD